MTMGQYEIYRKFYEFTFQNSGTSRTLINPVFLSANTFVAGSADTQSNQIIETELNVSQSQTGIYYVDLNPVYYSTDVVYDLVWYVTYTNSSTENGAIHQLTTRFKINNVQYIGTPIGVDVETNIIGIDVMNNSLNIEIIQD
jgi:hypothetical protein